MFGVHCRHLIWISLICSVASVTEVRGALINLLNNEYRICLKSGSLSVKNGEQEWCESDSSGDNGLAFGGHNSMNFRLSVITESLFSSD